MAELKELVIGFALLTLVVVATMYAVMEVGDTYEINDTNFGGFQLENFTQSMYAINDSANDLYKGVTPSKNPIADIWEGVTLFRPLITLANEILIKPIGLVFGIITGVLHFPSWLLIILTAVFLIAIIFGIIKLTKVGE